MYKKRHEIRKYTNTHMHVGLDRRNHAMHARACTHTYTNTSALAHTLLLKRTQACMRARTHAHMHTRTYTHSATQRRTRTVT